MKKIFLVGVALSFCTAAWGADKELLTPEPDRITDEAIAADTKVIQGMQKRLTDLNNKGVPIASYHFAKAQAWLDFALDEYTVNDRSRVVEEALRQALGTIEQLEKGAQQISLATPIIPTSAVVRPDLWEKAETMKKNADSFRCAGDKIAQLEVQLVWAGHEDRELGWRHSKPYLQAAERLAREADAQLAACQPEPVAKVLQPTPASATVNTPVIAPAAKPSTAVSSVASAATVIVPAPATAVPLAPSAKPGAAGTSLVASATAVVPVPVPAAPAPPVGKPAAAGISPVASATVHEAAPAAAPTAVSTVKPVATDTSQASAAAATAPVFAIEPAAAPAAKPHAAEELPLCPPCPKCEETAPGTISKLEEPLPDRVHFALNRAELSDESKEVLDRIAVALKAEPKLRVALHGHADQRGEALFNMKLSRQRATSVRAYLAEAGISADRIAIAAYGKTRPFIMERTIDGYARNRRVELVYSIGAPQRAVRQENDLQPEKTP